jgi:hypothetical protein
MHARLEERLLQSVDDRTFELLERRRRARRPNGRRWLIRRLLLTGDLLGLSMGFVPAADQRHRLRSDDVVVERPSAFLAFNAGREQVG